MSTVYVEHSSSCAHWSFLFVSSECLEVLNDQLEVAHFICAFAYRHVLFVVVTDVVLAIGSASNSTEHSNEADQRGHV